MFQPFNQNCLKRTPAHYLLFLGVFFSFISLSKIQAQSTPLSNCVNDKEPPVFKAMPQAFTVFTEECYLASWNVPVITDNCSTVTLTSNINIGDRLPLGIHKITMVAKDASGNKSTYSFTITIEQAIYIAPLNSSKKDVELIAHSTKSAISLNWLTKTNETLNYFVVQKANPQGDFIDIQTISSRSASGHQEYAFTDIKPESAENAYRIKKVLNDNTVEYSRTQTVNYKDKDFVQVYQNPTANIINVDLNPYINQNVRVLVYNTVGQPVYKQFIENATDVPLQIDVLDIPDGQYVLSINAKKDKEITKMLFIRE